MDAVVIPYRPIATARRRSPCIRGGLNDGRDDSRERIDIRSSMPNRSREQTDPIGETEARQAEGHSANAGRRTAREVCPRGWPANDYGMGGGSGLTLRCICAPNSLWQDEANLRSRTETLHLRNQGSEQAVRRSPDGRMVVSSRRRPRRGNAQMLLVDSHRARGANDRPAMSRRLTSDVNCSSIQKICSHSCTQHDRPPGANVRQSSFPAVSRSESLKGENLGTQPSVGDNASSASQGVQYHQRAPSLGSPMTQRMNRITTRRSACAKYDLRRRGPARSEDSCDSR